MKNLFLIGFMGTGKTTISEELQKKTGRELLDMDKEIERKEGKTVSEIFEQEGEDYFRNLETEFLKEMQKKESVIVSCGGGVPLREVNVEEMRKSGVIVLLSATPQTIYERVKDSHDRPILEENKSAAFIQKLMEKRQPFYQKAADLEICTDGKSVEKIVKEITDALTR